MVSTSLKFVSQRIMSLLEVLYYFAQSPFFDPQSENQSLISQWSNKPEEGEKIGTRRAFESNLKQRSGIQYLVAHDPLESRSMVHGANGPEPSGIWIIQKVRRQKSVGREDVVEVLAYYFIANQIIYQAPSLENIMQYRLVSDSRYDILIELC